MPKIVITEIEASGETLGAFAFRCVFQNEIAVLLSEGYMTPTAGEPLMFLVPASIFHQLSPTPPGGPSGTSLGAPDDSTSGDQIIPAAA